MLLILSENKPAHSSVDVAGREIMSDTFKKFLPHRGFLNAHSLNFTWYIEISEEEFLRSSARYPRSIGRKFKICVRYA